MTKQTVQVTSPLAPDLEMLAKLNAEIIGSGHYTNFGMKAGELEKKLCSFLGLNYLRLVNNGTMALQVILTMLAKKERRYVITTPFTFAATAGAIVMSGYEPYFVDIDSETLNLDVNKTKEVMEKIGGSVAAILPVHVFGNPCDPIEFEQLALDYGVPLLFDACHTFGSSYKDSPLCSYGDASAMSFHPTKIFHCGEGGGVVLSSESQFLKSREVANFGFSPSGSIDLIAGNSKLSEFNAAVGLSVLGFASQELKDRATLASIYDSKLREAEGVMFQKVPDDYVNNNQYYPIILEKESRERVVLSLNAEGVFPRKYFSPSLSSSLAYASFAPSQCVVSESTSQKVLCLPMYGSLSPEKVDMISSVVKRNI